MVSDCIVFWIISLDLSITKETWIHKKSQRDSFGTLVQPLYWVYITLYLREPFACECRTLSTSPSSLSTFPSAVTSRSSPPGMMPVCGGRVCPSGCGKYILRQSPEQSCYKRSSCDYPAPLLGLSRTDDTSLILYLPIFFIFFWTNSYLNGIYVTISNKWVF